MFVLHDKGVCSVFFHEEKLLVVVCWLCGGGVHGLIESGFGCLHWFGGVCNLFCRNDV